MIAGFAVTAGTVGALLDPFTFTRLVVICTAVAIVALLLTVVAVAGLEPRAASETPDDTGDEPAGPGFREALRDVISEQHTRRFALFVMISMLAYSAQDLVLEPFAGAVFGLTPGESTQLGGMQHAGVLLGMILVALLGSVRFAGQAGVLRRCMIGGCIASALLLATLAVGGSYGPGWPLGWNVFALGIATGVFAVAAIASMMSLVSTGQRNRDGMRMGIWGASQAVAFGVGGFAGTFAVDVTRYLTGSAVHAYGLVFVIQAVLFATAALLATHITRSVAQSRTTTMDLLTEAGQA